MNALVRLNRLATTDNVTEHDWSLVTEYDEKIQEANTVIQRAETQLAIKYRDINCKLHDINQQILAKSAANNHTNIEDEITLKKLYKKVAQLTHPDKCGNDNLFREAKRALRKGDRDTLYELLKIAQSEYNDLLTYRRRAYEEIIESALYKMSTDYLSDDHKRKEKAETYYILILQQTLNFKMQTLKSLS